MMRHITAASLLVIGSAVCASAAPGGAVDFQRDIQPILEQHCMKCHGPEKRSGGLLLTSRTTALLLTDSGKRAITPGDSAGSELIHRVTHADPNERMPRKAEPLAASQIALLTRWIDEGADWPAAKVEKHWAYVKPERADLPNVKNRAWPLNPIDHLVLARLEAEGLQPSSRADEAKLIRRVYLDLIGLPPTPAEVDAFVNDTSDRAYEKVVDHLLASPHFGEKRARPWLDLARYADSNGYQRDGFRTLWPYRDYVINAFNDDIGYDRFVIEQIAGDLIPGGSMQQKIATGFNRCTTVNVEAGVDQEENRTNQVFDRVNTMSTVFLGTSMECAQCHNHKYDPLSQQEYYQLFAYFNNTPIETKFRSAKSTASIDFVDGPAVTLPLPPQDQAAYDKLKQKLDAAKAELAAATSDIDQRIAAWEKQRGRTAENPPAWHALNVKRFASSGGASHEILEDQSVLLSGQNADKDVYTLTLAVPRTLEHVTAIRLEALAHPSLPAKGPGRGAAPRPNFVVNEMTVTLAAPDEPKQTQTLQFASATADFSQGRYPVSGLIDGDPATAWAINPSFGKDHHAIFHLGEPIDVAASSVLTVTLDHRYGGGRNIGRPRFSALTGDDVPRTIPQEIADILTSPADKRGEEELETLHAWFIDQDPKLLAFKKAVADVDRELAKIEPPTSLVMVEMDESRETHLMKRGSFLDPGPRVEPGVPAVLNPLPEGAPPTRLGLAQWMVQRDNPLTARVAVNRFWGEVFGHGIVTTPEDFGLQGERPTHPRLLDYLAVEFMENSWSVKHIFKLMAMSATYQQDARLTQELLERDPNNMLYARGPRFRLDAETIRDNALAIGGVLGAKVGGPPVFPPQPAGVWRVTGNVDNTYRTSDGEDRYRRGIYTIWRRSAPYPSMMNFDATDRSACTVRRPRTNTPLQALTLMNDPVYVELAMTLGKRVLGDLPDATLNERLSHAMRLCVAREPRTEELAQLAEVYQRELKHYQADDSGLDRLVGKKPQDDPAELGAWFAVANVLLNLDETITKP